MNIFGLEISEKIYMPILIIIIGYLLDLLVEVLLNSKIKNIFNKKLTKHEQRSRETVLMLFKNIIRILIVIISIVSILQIFGVNTSALVAGVGAVSLVIGLAFQDILKDILVGVAIILESQFAIGEIVEINGFKGEVVGLNLKTTRIKALSGETKIISNRSISEVTNYSLNNVLVKVIVSVSYEDDIEKVEKVLNNLIKKLNKSIDNLKEDIVLQGVESLSSSSVDFLLTTKTTEKNQYMVRRKIIKEVKLELDKNNIKIPYSQLEVHYEK